MIPDSVLTVGYNLLDKGLVPDFILRTAIRALCRQRLQEINHGSFETNHAAKMQWVENSRARETIAELTEKANEQHYEVSTDFILSCLGPFAKYSSCLYPTGKETLEEAEVLMMEMYCEKAKLRNGQYILDLGCGWGSLSLYLAQKYPRSQIMGLSNSSTQKLYIDAQAKKRGLNNVKTITADVNTIDFVDCDQFDRILSIEMFEHMKNYDKLLRKVSTWLKPSQHTGEGDDSNPSLLFVHIFCHKTMPYDFVEDDGWMAQTFFSGGTMPSHDLFLYYQSHLTLLSSSYISGIHYSRTLEHWLQRQDANAKHGLKELEMDAEKKGKKGEGAKAFYRFRVFYMACSELFAYNDGQEWGIGHYVFKRKD
ncbi:SAM-dependent methyltransferase [Heterobasidion irregulare TC 32-1]|uniref:SAM-dependent methyltransferase n=1 Tax=Heterobasidion irregulare (strain TC 32-1) TaxID=747525 RepID=W4K620_HETIT|nr:SAM-dependent methyltransferase [Heterobasidion irregulare TC 32-1]ETW80506.1 SAM-dependent methyltransferase [Heterobasidion irregulare TC 32-1]